MQQDKVDTQERHLRYLRSLPFVKEVQVDTKSRRGEGTDAILRIRSPKGLHLVDLVVKSAQVSYAVVDATINRHARAERAKMPKGFLLFAPHIGRPLGEYLVRHGVNYIDEAGNCHLALDDAFLAHIEGRTAVRRAGTGRGLGVPGHLVLFALLAEPDLVNSPMRALAEQAGVSKTAVENLLARLQHEGVLVRGREHRHLQNTKALLDRWLAGYSTLVRPRLLIGRYRTEISEPSQLERRIEEALAKREDWAWGGGAAATRLIHHYRGSTTVLHLVTLPPRLSQAIRALPSTSGELTILRIPGRVAFNGRAPRTVHPLLVYTELLSEGTERAREAAEMLRERFLAWL